MFKSFSTSVENVFKRLSPDDKEKALSDLKKKFFNDQSSQSQAKKRKLELPDDEESLKQLAQVLQENTKIKNALQAITDKVECPVCYTLPRSGPVPVCPRGHIVCSTCKRGTCPVCRAAMPAASSLLAGTIIQHVDHPCRHAGCAIKLPLDIVPEHERTCDHRLVNCGHCYKEQVCTFAALREHAAACPGPGGRGRAPRPSGGRQGFAARALRVARQEQEREREREMDQRLQEQMAEGARMAAGARSVVRLEQERDREMNQWVQEMEQEQEQEQERAQMNQRLAEVTGDTLGAVSRLREEERNSLIEVLGLGNPVVGMVTIAGRTGGARLMCPQCGDPCNSRADQRIHMTLRHPAAGPAAKVETCEYCGASFLQRYARRHCPAPA
jgi:hypothetical protein